MTEDADTRKGGSRPPFVVLEGIEGAGKSTQVELLCEWFELLGVKYRSAREPGGTPVGEAIRGVLLNRVDLDPPAESELFLILAARAAYVRDVVRPALEAGALMLSDRYAMSTLAYQGYGRELDVAAIAQANALATGGLEPDLVLVLDVPVEQGLSRRKAASGTLDRIESAGMSFLNRVAQGYRELSAEQPNVERIDAARGPTDVQEKLREALQRRFPEVFGSPASVDEESTR